MEELIGRKVRIKKSSMPELEGIKGTVTGETMKTLRIKTNGKEITVPKNNCTFEFERKGSWIEVKGKDIMFRPEERIKKHWRKMHARMRR